MATKKTKGNLTRCNGTMTESQFLAWIRSALRSKSLRWLPRASALEAARIPYTGENKRQKWSYMCAICKELFNGKEVVVDHYPKEAGSILSIEDIGEFINNLYCEKDNLRVLCTTCHDVHTLASKNNITFEEAIIEKAIIAKLKESVKDVVDFCNKNGYNDTSNAAKRKIAVQSIMRGK